MGQKSFFSFLFLLALPKDEAMPQIIATIMNKAIALPI